MSLRLLSSSSASTIADFWLRFRFFPSDPDCWISAYEATYILSETASLPHFLSFAQAFVLFFCSSSPLSAKLIRLSSSTETSKCPSGSSGTSSDPSSEYRCRREVEDLDPSRFVR